MHDIRGRMLTPQILAPFRVLAWLALVAVVGHVIARSVITLDPYYLVLASVCVAALLLFLRRLDIALFAYALLAPFVIGGSPEMQSSRTAYSISVLPSQSGLIVLTLLILARWFFSGREIRLPELTRPLAVFIGIAALSVAVSYFVWDADIPLSERRIPNQFAEVLLYSLCAVAFLAAANAFDRREWAGKMIWPVTLTALYVTVIELFFPETRLAISRAHFLVAIALILILSRMLLGRLRPAAVFGWTLIFIPLLYSIYHNLDWVSGWMAATVGMWFVILARSRKAAVTMMIIFLFVMFVYPSIYDEVYEQSRAEGDLDRIDMWVDAVQMALSVNPILGVGPSHYMPYSRKYGSVWYGETTYTTAHSNYANVIAEMGLAGILAFIWVLVAGVRSMLKLIRRSGPEAKWLVVGAGSVFAAFICVSIVGDYLFPSRVNGGITSFGTTTQVWVILGAAVAAAGTKTGREAEQDQEQQKEHEQEDQWSLVSR